MLQCSAQQKQIGIQWTLPETSCVFYLHIFSISF